METLSIKIEEKLKKYNEKINSSILKKIEANKNRYLAYLILRGTETSGWTYKINYKTFDENSLVAHWERCGYTVIDCKDLLG